MSEIEWTTEANGRVVGFSVHDAVIVRLELVEGEFVSLIFRGSSGNLGFVRLEEPSEINIEQFFDGAIASDLYAWKVQDAPPLDQTAPDCGWNALLRSRYREADIRKFAAEIVRKNRNSYLVVLECSYGGSIAVVCKRMIYSTMLSSGQSWGHNT